MASITCDFSYGTEEFSQSGMGTVLQQSGNGWLKNRVIPHCAKSACASTS